MANIQLGGSVGTTGTAILGAVSIIFTSDADHTMSVGEYTNNYLYVDSSPTLTATRNLIAPVVFGQSYVVYNTTAGGQSIQIIGATGTGVTIPPGTTETVICDGTNYLSLSGAVTLLGDVTGSSSANTLSNIQGTPVSLFGSPAANQSFIYDGSAWTNQIPYDDILIYRPGATGADLNSPNVYTSWTELYLERHNNQDNPMTIIIDDRFVSPLPATPDPGRWNLFDNTTIRGWLESDQYQYVEGGFTNNVAQFQIPDFNSGGSQLDGVSRWEYITVFQASGSTANGIINSGSYKNDYCEFFNAYFYQNSDTTASLISVSYNTNYYMYGNSAFYSFGGPNVVEVSGDSELQVFVFDFAEVDSGVINVDSGSTLNLVQTGPSQRVSNAQSGPGTIIVSGTPTVSIPITTGTYFLTLGQYGHPYLMLTGTLSGSVTLDFGSASPGDTWIVDATAVTLSGHTITLAAGGNDWGTTVGVTDLYTVTYGNTGFLYGNTLTSGV